MMKKYYYLIGDAQNGPFTIDELKDKELSRETLFWAEDMEGWKELKELPELVEILKPKKTPPPPPINNDNSKPNSESKELNKAKNENRTNKNTNKLLKWLILWCSFHLFALLMSYSQIKIFCDHIEQRTDCFWPFVNFYYGDYNQYYNGLFVHYDITEFLFYVGGAIIIFVFYKLALKK